MKGISKQNLGFLVKRITSGSRGWAGYYAESGAIFLRMTNLPRNGIRLKMADLKYVKLPSKSSEGKRTSVKEGDILISITAELGKIGYVEESRTGEAYVNQHICLLRIDHEKADSKYLAYYLSDAKQRALFQKLNDAGAKAGLSLPTIKSYPVELPPLPEQKKIAEILGECDEAIEAQERLIALKQQRKKGLMQQLLTGKTRFPRFLRSTEKLISRFFYYPADWKLVRIGEIADQVIRRNSFGELPVLSCTKHRGLVDSLSYFKKQVYAENTSGYKVVERGEFAFATNHLEEGSIGYQNIYDKAIISPIYCVFKTRKSVEDPWLYLLLKTELFRHIFEANTNASVNRRGSIRWNEFRNIHVALPSLKEQRHIALYAKALSEEITLQQQKLEQLKQQKKGLMQQLLTGKVRVKV
ncbi:MAG: restriction endonuclease subunit S [Opitutales bacterium]|nr:restriction endonuclease subunit S [Opitutales bacterium]